MNEKHWFWHNKVMAWIESGLISLTNWFWKKRHPPTPKPRIAPTLDEIPKENTPKKRTPRKTTKTQKKDQWSVKE
jgi:hypothetical protein